MTDANAAAPELNALRGAEDSAGLSDEELDGASGGGTSIIPTQSIIID